MDTRDSGRSASKQNNNNSLNSKRSTTRSSNTSKPSHEIEKKRAYAENLPEVGSQPSSADYSHIPNNTNFLTNDLEGALDLRESNDEIENQISVSILRRTAIYYSPVKRLLLLLKQAPINNSDNNNNFPKINYTDDISMDEIIGLQTLEMEKFKHNEHYKLFSESRPKLVQLVILNNQEKLLYDKVTDYFTEATKIYDKNSLTNNSEIIKDLFYAYYACCKLKNASSPNQETYAKNALIIAICLEHVIERHSRLIKQRIADLHINADKDNHSESVGEATISKNPVEWDENKVITKELRKLESIFRKRIKHDPLYIQFFEDFSSLNPFQKYGTKSFNSPTRLQNQYARALYPFDQAKFGPPEPPEKNSFRIQLAHKGSRYTVTEHTSPQAKDSIQLTEYFTEYVTNQIEHTRQPTKKIGKTTVKSTELLLLNPFDLHANINASIIVELLSLEQFTNYVENFLNLCEKLSLQRTPNRLSDQKSRLKIIVLNGDILKIIDDLHEQLLSCDKAKNELTIPSGGSIEEDAQNMQLHIIDLDTAETINNNTKAQPVTSETILSIPTSSEIPSVNQEAINNSNNEIMTAESTTALESTTTEVIESEPTINESTITAFDISQSSAQSDITVEKNNQTTGTNANQSVLPSKKRKISSHAPDNNNNNNNKVLNPNVIFWSNPNNYSILSELIAKIINTTEPAEREIQNVVFRLIRLVFDREFSLSPIHDYKKDAADKVRNNLNGEGLELFEYYNALLSLAWEYTLDKKLAEANELLNKINIRINPRTYFLVHFMRGCIEYVKADYDAACNVFESIVNYSEFKCNDNLRVGLYINLALTYCKLQNKNLVIEYLEKITQLNLRRNEEKLAINKNNDGTFDVKHPCVYYISAILYLSFYKVKAAYANIQTAIKQDPSKNLFYSIRALTYGSFEVSEKCLQLFEEDLMRGTHKLFVKNVLNTIFSLRMVMMSFKAGSIESETESIKSKAELIENVKRYHERVQFYFYEVSKQMRTTTSQPSSSANSGFANSAKRPR